MNPELLRLLQLMGNGPQALAPNPLRQAGMPPGLSNLPQQAQAAPQPWQDMVGPPRQVTGHPVVGPANHPASQAPGAMAAKGQGLPQQANPQAQAMAMGMQGLQNMQGDPQAAMLQQQQMNQMNQAAIDRIRQMAMMRKR